MPPLPLELRQRAVGPWPMNTYAFVCPSTHQSVLIDPGADPDALVAMLAGSTPIAILITHTHRDHIGALDEMRQRLKVPVVAHAGRHWQNLALTTDRSLADGETFAVGQGLLRAQHAPGHCPDMLAYSDVAGVNIVVGDTVFDGGPGRTATNADFQVTLHTLRAVVLRWPDEAICHPGHGPSFRLGDRRAAIEAFVARDHGDFAGDAVWPAG